VHRGSIDCVKGNDEKSKGIIALQALDADRLEPHCEPQEQDEHDDAV
jgi:hypothetical protein